MHRRLMHSDFIAFLHAVIAKVNSEIVRPINTMAVAVETPVSDALSFNAIKTFEDLDKDLDKATLTAMADIFVRHRMHVKLGVGLLHCHDALRDGTLTVPKQ